ncbi:hypothetical protein NP493_29g06009 [Ridgeia piscesae]|uniref:Secreted protein n=1 Tax=Ridgeia piscesae TaxID=27915 RepID=A0AAD9PD30_RIDPI|nr:hypothetical protein NP493_29g06009 [Ridgeia piscesae]
MHVCHFLALCVRVCVHYCCCASGRGQHLQAHCVCLVSECWCFHARRCRYCVCRLVTFLYCHISWSLPFPGHRCKSLDYTSDGGITMYLSCTYSAIALTAQMSASSQRTQVYVVIHGRLLRCRKAEQTMM